MKSDSKLMAFTGRENMELDRADPVRLAGLAALLDHGESPWQPDMLPPLGHWLCFPPQVRQSLLGPDGHPIPTEEGLIPPTGLPRRMWAGSRIQFVQKIPVESPLRRRSTVVSVSPKTGRSGKMVFVTLRHEISVQGQGPAIIEEQDLVYREASTGPALTKTNAVLPPATGQDRIVTIDEVMLFRFSALTFNGHRIHYDRQYAREEEHYPDLVVHGPFTATLLMDHLLRTLPGIEVQSFSFRASAPLFVNEPVCLSLSGDQGTYELKATSGNGLAVSATVMGVMA